MKTLFAVILMCMVAFGGCSNKEESKIIGNWESSTGEELYFNDTDMFDSGFAIPYKIKNDTEFLVTDATGSERSIEYSIVDDTLTIKIGDKGMVYYKVEKEETPQKQNK